LISKLGWVPDLIHCNDWQCGLVPAYLKNNYKDKEELQNVKTLFTIHNLAYQGVFKKTSFKKTNLPEKLYNENGVIHKNKMNFMKAGLMFADAINTVSETYSKEICNDEELSGGLNKILCKRKKDVYGIMNGIDDKTWNPENDNFIEKKYNSKNLEDKIENKKVLLDKFNLEYKEDVPLIGIISRLYNTKGFDLLKKAFNELMKMDIQMVLLGTGERKYHEFFEEAMMKHQDKFACYLGFDDELAHLIEAGSDMFLMPSKYEPCGLNQMYSLMYGTVPIVRETGGLADTVDRYNEKKDTGNGFAFKSYDAKALVSEVKRAVKIFQNKNKWQKIMKTGMKSNFSWLNSSKNYVDLYKKIVG
jgi:starch synthase